MNACQSENVNINFKYIFRINKNYQVFYNAYYTSVMTVVYCSSLI